MAREYETEDGVRIAPLSDLRDFEVAEGYPDIRGWRVDSADGREVGKVHDLLIDIDNMRTRYLDVRLTKELAASPEDRDVLVPIGTAQIVDDGNRVRIPLSAERVGLLPMYDHDRLTRADELEVRRHFSLGEVAATGATGAAARAFYDDEGYNDRRFFGARREARAEAHAEADRAEAKREEKREDKRADVQRDEAKRAEERAADERVEQEKRAAQRAERESTSEHDAAEREREREHAEHDRVEREIHASDSEVRVPIHRDESVVLRRGDDGQDEIIIRRPVRDEGDRPRP
jgi:sporulation protein YlmC with PRC-barrel domain